MRVAIALLFCVVACVYADLPLCPPDIAQEFCQQGETCCDIDATEIGCCPLPNASCCDDKQSCCAQGYSCGATSGTCTPKDGRSVMKALALKRHHH